MYIVFVLVEHVLLSEIYICHYRPKKTLNSKKYGVDLICYTHAVNTALHSSTKVDGLYFVNSY